nr:uncharacterized protein LOC113766746 [Ipomoea batatas]
MEWNPAATAALFRRTSVGRRSLAIPRHGERDGKRWRSELLRTHRLLHLSKRRRMLIVTNSSRCWFTEPIAANNRELESPLLLRRSATDENGRETLPELLAHRPPVTRHCPEAKHPHTLLRDSFLSKPPVFTGENDHAWSVKMRTYLKAHGLWEMMEIDEVPALPEDPTIAQMREYREEKKKMNKAKTCIHSALTDEVFTKIMTCKTAKQAWVLLKNEYEGNDRTKRMQVLNLKRELEMQKMKETESLKDYSERLKKVVNKIRLLGEELPDDRVVEKILTFFMHLKLKNKEGPTGMKVIFREHSKQMRKKVWRKIGSSAGDSNFDPLTPGHPSKTPEEENVQALTDGILKMCAEVQTLKDEAQRLKACLALKEDNATMKPFSFFRVGKLMAAEKLMAALKLMAAGKLMAAMKLRAAVIPFDSPPRGEIAELNSEVEVKLLKVKQQRG